MSVTGKQHSEVVAAIKAGGNETRLLVVDIETDKFFSRCNVLPTEEHLTGTQHTHAKAVTSVCGTVREVRLLCLFLHCRTFTCPSVRGSVRGGEDHSTHTHTHRCLTDSGLEKPR